MTVRRAPWLAWLPVLFLLWAPPPLEADEEEAPPGEAEAPEAAGEGPETNPLKPAEDDQAKELAAALKKAARKKDAAEVLPALEAIEGWAHEDFDKPLLKLLRHVSAQVSEKAADMWEWRVRDEKLASKLWRASWADRRLDKRYELKARVLKAFARAGVELDRKQFDEVEKDWRWIVGNPDPRFAPALASIARWVELSKDPRLFRRLAEELDEPTAENPNSPSNPPASWWEKRWKLWKASKPAVVGALKAITGKEFDKSAEAKAWWESEGKAAGIEW